MPNDFEPVVGYRFTFQTKPMGDWDGIVHCEVLQCDPPSLLRYSWKGGADTNRGLRLATRFRGDLDADAGRGWHRDTHGA